VGRIQETDVTVPWKSGSWHYYTRTEQGRQYSIFCRKGGDDNEEVIRNRLEVYREQTAPLIQHYRERDQLVAVEASGTVEEIGARIETLLS